MHEAPIACTLTGDEMTARQNYWQAIMRAALLERTDISGGIRLRFRGDPDVAPKLERLIAAERECCQFLDMTLTPAAGDLVLDITGAPEAQPALNLMFSPATP